jgi:amino acid adenylation domain-containing protein
VPGAQRQTLTRAQQALWDLQESLPDGPVNVAQYLDLRGPADIVTIDRVGRRYFDRMLVMSSRFERSKAGPVLVHDPDLWMGADRLDFRDAADPESAAWDWMVADAATRPDLFTDRLVRFAYLQIADDRLFVYTRSHHTLADGVTGITAFNTWASIYSDALASREPTYPPPVDLSAALAADVDYQRSPRRDRDAAYWRTQLAGLPAPVSLSRRSARPAATTRHVSDIINRTTLATLRDAETLHRTSLPAIIATALAVYTARMTSQDDVVIALPVAARTTAALRTATLPVSNIAPIRVPVATADSVLDVLAATQSSMIGALRHQRYRYEDMLRDQQPDASSLGLAPGVSGPVLNLMLFEPSVRFGDAVGTIQIVTTGPVDDLALTLYYRVAPDETIDIQLDLDTNPRRYTDTETAAHHQRILRMIGTVADALVTAPTRTVASLPLLTDEQRFDLVSVTGPSGPPPRTLPQILADAAATHGPSIALADGERSWSYTELARDADRIAGHLRERGARPGATVAIATGRGTAQARALWAVARTGASILLLDPDLPPIRSETILADAAPIVTVTTDDIEMWSTTEPSVGANSSEPHIDDVAYIVYTSGTTGTPKGVAVTHRGLAALTADLAARFDDGHDAVVAQLASPTFDATYFEHLLAVALGGRLVPAPPGTVIGAALADHLTANAVTHAVVTPSVLSTVPAQFATHSQLRVLLTAGEALSTALVRQWSPGRTMVNLYGPAEATVMATAGAPLAPSDAVTDPNAPADAPAIGRPVTAMRAYVLDTALQPVPAGAAGELYLAGPALAQGYRGDSSLTATRFVPCLWSEGTRMYRTGDIAAWDDTGSLRYIGRTDDQVQIRGVRVEPAEIELAATGLTGVRAAAAVIADGTITLHIATAVTGGVMRSRVRRHLATRLPPAMWPSRIMTVDQLPVTSTGKVDRAQLLSPASQLDEAHQPPRSRVETAVADAIADTLGISTPSVLADIIELGATSLNAAQIASALSERLATTVAVRDVLQATTPADLAAAISDRAVDGGVEFARPSQPPASPQQTALVIDARTDPDSTANVLRGSLEISGPGVDAEIVRAVIADVVSRHEALRTIVRVGSATLWQDVIDPDAALEQIMAASRPDVADVLDPTATIPARVAVHDVDTATDNRVRVDIAIHHILIDDRSIDVLIDDLAESFAARVVGRAPTFTARALQYADATHLLAQHDGAADLDWWTTQLAARAERPRLPVDMPPSVTGRRPAAVVSTHVGDAVLDHLGRGVYSHLHAAIAAVTARYTGTDDVWIGVAHAGRDLLPARPAVGMFANPIVVRTRVPAETTLAALAETTAAQLRAAQRHSATPFGDVARAVEPGRDVTEAPLTDVLISYRETPRDALDLGGVSVTVTEEPATHARVPLQWNLDRRGDGVAVSLTYRADLFSGDLVNTLLDALSSVVNQMAVDPHRRLHEALPGDTVARGPSGVVSDLSLVDVVRRSARQHPDAPAIRSGGTVVTYAELVDAAASLAGDLAAAGVVAGDRVAVAAGRTRLALIGHLAVLMAGAAFVPIDVALPRARVDTLLRDCRPSAVLVTAATDSSIDVAYPRVTIRDAIDAAAQTVSHLVDAVAAAYVIYTSGTTGPPKGVTVSHRGVVGMLEATNALYGYRATDVFSCTHSLSFDFSVFEVFAAWHAGASVVLIDADTAADPAALWTQVIADGVTVLSQTPSAFTPLAVQAVAQPVGPAALRQIVFGGEALRPSRIADFAVRFGDAVRLDNLWGITEGAVHVTAAAVDTADARSLIGAPIGAMGVSVLDRWLRHVPRGVWGELYITGPQLADGYLDRQALTASRFVADPFGAPGDRMYRTGDRVRQTLDAGIEYGDRLDNQVQLRGFRVELGAVAAAARALGEVADSEVIVRDPHRPDGGVLTAYVIAAAGATVRPERIRDALASVLPTHEVPAAVIVLDEWPVTSSGKLDRSRLPAADPAGVDSAPMTPVADTDLRAVTTAIGDVLEIAPADIDIDRSLVELGANSLSYMHIAVVLAESTGRQVPIATIARAASVRALAAALADAPVRHAVDDTVPTGDYRPSPQQQGLWVLNRVDPVSTVYHLPALVELDADVDPATVAAALGDVIARHDALRTTISERDGIPLATIGEPAAIQEQARHELTTPTAIAAADLPDAARRFALAPFDLSADVGWRVRAFAVTDGVPHLALAVVVHHAVADGWSLQVIAGDLDRALQARAAGHPPVWDGPAAGYRDHATRSVADPVRAAQLDHWRAVLDDAPIHFSLPRPASAPTDRSGPEPAEHIDTTIAPGVHAGIERLAENTGTTVFHVVHTALAYTLATFTGADDIVIGTPTAGRDTAGDLSGVGMYVRMVVLRSRVGTDTPVTSALAASTALLADAVAHSAISYEEIISVLSPARTTDTDPYLDVLLAFAQQDMEPTARIGSQDSFVRAVTPIRVPHARVPLEFSVTDRGADAGLAITLTVGTWHVDLGAAQRILRHLTGTLAALAETDATASMLEVLDGVAVDTPMTDLPAVPTTDPVDAIRRWSDQQPDHPAILHGTTQVSYRDLVDAVDSGAAALRRNGIGVGSRVAVVSPRTPAAVALAVAVLELGACLVPIDSDYPSGRIDLIRAASQPDAVVTVRPERHSGADAVVMLGATVTIEAAHPRPAAPDVLGADLPAYVIYTSGSTGTPKGVVVTRGNLAAMLAAAPGTIDAGPDDVWTWFHSPAFDFSVWEMFAPLVTGGSLVVIDADVAREPAEFALTLETHRVTVLSQTPTAFTRLTDLDTALPTDTDPFGHLRWVVFGGEALMPAALADWRIRHPNVGLLNMFGITETTVHLTHGRVRTDDRRSLIGDALPGVGLHVLDRRLRPVPLGARGELYVTGAQVAAGYLDDTPLTATRFVAAPVGVPGSRMYRTGDHVRRVDATTIEYLGRVDQQVQLRGHRVELGEVIATVRADPQVADVRVVLRPGVRRGEETLVAFVIAHPDHAPARPDLGAAAIDTAAVAERCAATLPAHLVPATVVEVTDWPLTTSGKLDTAALLDDLAATGVDARPLTATEAVVAAVVADVTGLDTPDGPTPGTLTADSNFFELGGNSLSAARLAAALTDIGASVSVRAVFEHPTIAMLATLVDRPRADAVDIGTPPVPVARPERLPLTPQQEEIWSEWQLDPTDTGYHLATLVPLTSVDVAGDADRIAHAVRAVIDRHDALRTSYPADADGPHQRLWSTEAVLPDLTPTPVTDLDEAVAQLHRPFDLATEVPWRVLVAEVPEDAVTPPQRLLGAAIHHIAGDGHSIALIESELRTLLQTPGAALPEALDFASYTTWFTHSLAARRAVLTRFWSTTFATPVTPLRLPGLGDDSVRGQHLTESSVVSTQIDARTHVALRAFAAAHHTTLFMTVHTALAALLARRSGTDDIVIGTATSGRVHENLVHTVGMFARTVPLRTTVDVERTFADLLAAVTGADLASFAHADLPAAEIAHLADPSRTAAGRPITPVFLADVSSTGDTRLAGDDIGSARARFGLDVLFAPVDTDAGSALQLRLLHRLALVDTDLARGLVDDLATLLTAVITRSDEPVANLLVGDIDRDGSPVSATTLGEMLAGTVTFADRAALTWRIDGPGASGNEWEDVTYAELAARAAGVGARLTEAGVRPGDLVGIHAPRSLWSVIGMWAAAGVGAAFVHLNPADPPARRRRILSDSGVAAVLHDPASRPDDLGADTVGWIPIDEVASPNGYAPPRVPPDARAYVTYTSGSTGDPKGVEVTHRGIGPLVETVTERAAVTDASVVLHNYSPSFDAHLIELLPAFAAGARVVICPPEVIGGNELRDLITRSGVDSFFSTPSVLSTLDPGDLSAVRAVIVGGEALPRHTAAAWSSGRRMINFYGPTETTVAVTGDTAVGGGPVTIGGALPGVGIRVLDARLRPVPAHTVGELYITGPAVAQSYLGRPDLTAERFVADPWAAPGQPDRMYRTGDLVHRTADGVLVIDGRADDQLAVRGVRVEPGEITAALTRLPGVADAVAGLHRTRSGTDVLAAWVMADRDIHDALDADTLRSELRQMLPRALVPAVIVVIDEIPRTGSGKLDRAALPRPALDTDPASHPPTTGTELAVAKVWAEVIGVEADEIDMRSDFFALGGTSLSATRVVGRLAEHTGRTVSVRDLFDARTVADLAALLDVAPTLATTDAGSGVPVHQEVTGPLPLSYPQRRLWILHRIDPTSTAYTVPLVLRIDGALDVEALRTAVAELQRRHDSLRTVYPDTPDGPRQQVLPTDAVTPPPVREVERDSVSAVIAEIVSAPFDLTRAPAFRAEILHVDPAGTDAAEWVLVAATHHVAIDGWSMRTVMAELVSAYADGPGRDPLTTLTYADFTRWQLDRLGDPADETSEFARQMRYWTRTLAGAGDPVALPGRLATPLPGGGGRAWVDLDDAVMDGMRTVAQAESASVFHLVHAVLATVLAQWTGRHDIVIGAPVLGRSDPAWEPVVGMFVNTVALRTAVAPDDPLRATLRRVRDTDLAATDHDDVPYDAVARAVRPRHHGRGDPLVSVLLVQQELRAVLDDSTVWTDAPVDGLRVRLAGDPDALVAAKFDVEVVLAQRPGEPWSITVIHSAVIPPTTAHALLDEIVAQLHAAAGDPDAPLRVGSPSAPTRRPTGAHRAADAIVARPEEDSGDDVTAMRAVLAEVLSLRVSDVGADDDFFALGGTSLSATQVVSLVDRRLGASVSVAAVFDDPTARGLARALDSRSGAETTGRATPSSMPVPRTGDPIPLTSAQRRIWFVDRLLERTSSMNVVPLVVEVPDGVDTDGVRSALRAVADRHAPLRSVYPDGPDGPYAVVRGTVRPEVEEMGAITDLDVAVSTVLRRGFDISTDPPIRAVLIGGNDHRVLLVVAHHIAIDGESVPILTAELRDAMVGRWLPPLDVGYPRHALWEAVTADARRADDLAFWTTALDGHPGVLDLPTDRPRTGDRPLDTAMVVRELPAEVASAVERIGATTGLTRFGTLHAALALVLGQWAGTDDVAIGAPVSSRRHPETAGMVGMFVSTVVLRTRIAAGTPLRDALGRVRSTDAAALDHTLLGFDAIVGALNPPRDAGRHPLVQVMISLVDTDGLTGLGALAPADGSPGPDSEFDLQLTVSAGEDSVGAVWTYSTALFDHARIADIADRWQRALLQMDALLDRTDARPATVDDIDLRPAGQIARHAALAAVPPIADPVILAEILARTVHDHPHAVALDDGTTVLTYDDLDQWSDEVADALLGAGVVPGDVVAVRLERSTESVVAMWAVARVGAAYAPIDPRYPTDRIRRMVDIVGARVEIGDGSSDVSMSLPPRPAGRRTVSAPRPVPVDAPAYIVFTSGSTGTPNAVSVTHRGLSLYADPATFGLGYDDRVAHMATPSFDAALLEILMATAVGARLMIVSPDRVGGEEGTTELAHRGVTALFVTPAVLATLDPAPLAGVTAIWAGGDAVTPDVVNRWNVDRRFEVGYGPSEATIFATHWVATDKRADAVLIGDSYDTVGSLVLDHHLRPVPDGVVGELYLVGPALAQGYHDAGLTASRFVATPGGDRMYRTGDRVRRTATGLAFEGRSDGQRQIRGLRVETGEVNAALVAAGAAQAATVVVAGPAGDVLVSYVVGGPGDLRNAVADRLPAHMVPARIIDLDQLPLSPVGKVDTAVLPAPQWDAVRGGAPTTPTETAVLAVFRDVLDNPSIGVDDDYFAVGGTSLQLVSVASELRSRGLSAPPLTAVFTHPTPAALAAAIDAGVASDTDIPAEIAALLSHVIDLSPADRALNSVDRALNPVDRAVNSVDRALNPADRAETPLWMVHPASGVASMYRPLAEVVTGIGPVFGLQLPDLLDTTPTSPRTVSELAAAHLEAVRSRQPHGPYRFGGWSVGGQVAHEMAHLAAVAGETVDIVVLLDARVGVDVAEAGAEALTIDPDTAEALSRADATRFAAYTRRVEEIAASAAAFAPTPTPIADLVMVAASDTTDAAVDRWRDGPARVTVERVDAVHADMGEPATMRAIGEMLSMAMSEIAAAADRPGGPTDEPTANRGHR